MQRHLDRVGQGFLGQGPEHGSQPPDRSPCLAVTDQVEQARALDQARAAAELVTQRFHVAIEALPAGFELWDAQDRLVMVNSVMGELYPRIADQLVPGRTYESLVRANCEAGGLVIPDAEVDGWLQRRLALRRAADQATVVHRTDQGRVIRVNERRTRDGGVVGVRIDVTELHEQQAAAEAARQSAERASERLHDAIEALPDGFALFDAEDQLVICNGRGGTARQRLSI